MIWSQDFFFEIANSLLLFYNFISLKDTENVVTLPTYRVSHSNLWWGYRFWFLLVFWILRVHEMRTLILSSSIFKKLMLRALYKMICKSDWNKIGTKSLNVSNVKLLSDFFQRFMGFFDTFLFSSFKYW